MNKKENLTEIINIRLTSQELNTIKHLATKHGMSTSECVRNILFCPDFPTYGLAYVHQKNFFYNLILNSKIAPKTKEIMLSEVTKYDIYNY